MDLPSDFEATMAQAFLLFLVLPAFTLWGLVWLGGKTVNKIKEFFK